MLRQTYKYKKTGWLLTIGWVGLLLLHHYYWRDQDWMVWVAILLGIAVICLAFAEGPNPDDKKRS